METSTEEMLMIAEVLGEVKARTDKLETEFFAQTRPLEAALAGIKALQYHVLDNNLGALSVRVEEQRRAISEQVATVVAALETADKTNLVASEALVNGLRAEVGALCKQIEQLDAQYKGNVERMQLEVQRLESLARIPGPPGTGMTGAGVYDMERTYQKGDIVSYLGASYVSNVNDNDEKPGPKAKKWTQLVGRPSSYANGSEGSGGASFIAAPSTATSAGTAGQMAYTAFHFYICIAANTWRRVAIGAW